MAYQLIEFDGVPLPLGNPEQDHTGTPVETALLDSIGGAFDYSGAARKRGRRQTISLSGVYDGETTYWVDEAGNRLVDEDGNYLIIGLGPNMLRNQVAALTEKRGVRGALVRKRFDDDVREQKTARLLAIGWRQTGQAGHLIAEVECTFETLDDAWRLETAATATASPTAGVLTALNPDNGGEATILDAVLTVECTSGTITQLDIDANVGIDLVWTGSLATGETLTMDCGAQTVQVDGVDSYSGFALGSGHTVAGWLLLEPGLTPLTVLCAGGAADVTITYYPKFF